tara:strand:- start:630 stop:1202 length:573 start_codon:yes stop_codon:yes gene_type:complete
VKKEKLVDYILHLKNWIPKKITKKTVKEISKKTWEPHTHIDFKDLKTIVRKNELDVCWSEDSLTYNKELHDLIWKALEKYILKEYKNKYHRAWAGFSLIKFNRYSKGQIMTKHIDHIKSLFEGERRGNPTLSIIGALNNNYTGGELIFFDNYKITLKEGDIILFPSNFLYPHKVKPVTKGKRYSFVSWSW